MRGGARKSTPGVRGGKVQKKNRTDLSPDIYVHEPETLLVQRIRPARGFYHAVSVTDVRRFIGLIGDWQTVASGVRAVILTSGGDDCYGRYNNVGIIKLDAWPKTGPHFVPERKAWLMNQMGVSPTAAAPGGHDYELTTSQVRCFLLLGTFLHELGHHIDRMSTRSKRDSANGEPAAIAYELQRQRDLWGPFCNEFGVP